MFPLIQGTLPRCSSTARSDSSSSEYWPPPPQQQQPRQPQPPGFSSFTMGRASAADSVPLAHTCGTVPKKRVKIVEESNTESSV